MAIKDGSYLMDHCRVKLAALGLHPVQKPGNFNFNRNAERILSIRFKDFKMLTPPPTLKIELLVACHHLFLNLHTVYPGKCIEKCGKQCHSAFFKTPP